MNLCHKIKRTSDFLALEYLATMQPWHKKPGGTAFEKPVYENLYGLT